MKIKAIIVEDEQDSQITLKNMLTKFCEGVEVVACVDRVTSAVSAIVKYQPDVVFLDIELPGQNGFELFKYIADPKFDLIFTTAYDEFAVRAFKMSAIDYLLKPIDLKELRQAVRKVNENRETEILKRKLELLKNNTKSEINKICLPLGDGYYFIKLSDLIYCKADGNYTSFVLANGEKHLVTRTLKNYAELLEDLNFFRASRSHLVNLDHIVKYNRSKQPSLIMSDQTVIKLSLGRREEFLKVASIK